MCVCVWSVQCGLCSVSVSSNTLLMSHVLTHFKSSASSSSFDLARVTSCRICPIAVTFSSPFDLQRHVHQVQITSMWKYHDGLCNPVCTVVAWCSFLGGGVTWRQSHCRSSGLATLPSVGAVPSHPILV